MARFGKNGNNPDPKATMHIQCKLTEKQWFYIKAKSVLENEEMQMVMRRLIEKAYDNELKNGIDVVALAMDNNLI